MEYLVQTNGLTKKYETQTVIKNVNLHVKPGTIYGLLGRNGAGKTTIMKMMLGLTKITEGSITLFGKSLCDGNKRKIYPRIGSIIEAPGFYPNLTGTENLKIFSMLRGTVSRDEVKKALEIVGLPYKDKKLYSNYSLGMKQRLGIANAIMHDPELLILDEPINGLDPIGIVEIREFLEKLCKERGKTIIISSHILSEIDLIADDIGIINNGYLIEESSVQKLRDKNQKYILFRVSDSSRASMLIEQKFGIKQYKVEDEAILKVYQTNIVETNIINRFLMENEIDVFETRICNDSLEDYFKKITGGEGIA